MNGSFAVLDLTSPWLWVAVAIIVLIAAVLLLKLIVVR